MSQLDLVPVKVHSKHTLVGLDQSLQALRVKLGYIGFKVAHEPFTETCEIGLLKETVIIREGITYRKSIIVVARGRKVDVQLQDFAWDLLPGPCLPLLVVVSFLADILRFTNEPLVWIRALAQFCNWHLGLSLDLVYMLADNEAEIALRVCITCILVEDLDLVLDADATRLSQSLDAVGDLTGLAHALQLWCQGNVEHHVRSFVRRLLSPFTIINDVLFELLLDLQHAFLNLAVSNHDLSSGDVVLDLVVGQLSQGLLELSVELLPELLSARFVLCGNGVLDVSVLVLVVLDLHAVELLLDVSLEGPVSV